MKMKTKVKKLRKSSSSSHNNDAESSDLHTAVIRIAVAQICKSVGYVGAQTSALETLTDVAARYLQSLSKSAATSATSTGRTQCNLLDVICALENLHYDVGFHGNSDLNRRLYILTDSSILRDTMKFVYSTREIPFAKPLPRRFHTVPSTPASFVGESDKWKHIPRWLPDFPEITGLGEKIIVPAASEDDGTSEKKKFFMLESDRKISKLPEKRKKVSFRIGCWGRNVIKVESAVDLRSGIYKGRNSFIPNV